MFIETSRPSLSFRSVGVKRNLTFRSYGALAASTATVYKHCAPLELRTKRVSTSSGKGFSKMNTGVEVAIISAAASIIVAAVSWVVTARQKRADELRKLKMERYSELLVSISDLVVYGLNEKTQARYSSAFNTIALTAPQTVIKALFEFQDHTHVSNKERSP